MVSAVYWTPWHCYGASLIQQDIKPFSAKLPVLQVSQAVRGLIRELEGFPFVVWYLVNVHLRSEMVRFANHYIVNHTSYVVKIIPEINEKRK